MNSNFPPVTGSNSCALNLTPREMLVDQCLLPKSITCNQQLLLLYYTMKVTELILQL